MGSKIVQLRADARIGMRVGGTVVVTHDDGNQGTKTTEGKLHADDDSGYVVVEDENNPGTFHYIPKGRVIEITSS